jgi:hypothetical protein
MAILTLNLCYGCQDGSGDGGRSSPARGGGNAFAASPGPPRKAKKLALLVGIDKYKAINGLSGCVADVRKMEALLKHKFDFPEDAIQVLTDERATHVGIVRSFRDHLISRAETGAVIVFHYSGHGSQMKDPSDRASSALISTIVPHDSRTEGVFDISADELRGLFSLLSPISKNVTFVFDSCHSGLLMREISENSSARPRARVAEPDPRIPPPPPPEARLVPRGVGEAGAGIKGRGFALLSACQADEVAFEYDDPMGNPCGTLTHFFVAEVLGSGKAGATYRDVMDKVKAKVTGVYRRQHPQLEGARIDDYLLSDESSLAQPFVLASPEGDGIAIEAGQVHGMTQGSVFDIYAPGTKAFDDPAKAIARSELTSVDVYRSKAKLIGGRSIERSSRAVERQHSFRDRKVRLHIAAPDRSPVLRKLLAATAGSGRTDPDNPTSPSFEQTFELVDKPDAAQLLLSEQKTKGGARAIALTGGDATRLSPPASVDAAGAAELILERLAGWTKRHRGRGDARARLCIAADGDSAALRMIRQTVTGQGRTDPDDPGAPSFKQAFEVVDRPDSAQVILDEKAERGTRLVVLSTNANEEGSLLVVPIDAAGAVALVLERLTAWAKWLNVLHLDNPRRGLDVAFEVRPSDGGGRDPGLASRPDLTLVAGEPIDLTVTNRSLAEVYFAILDLAADGSVDVVYPAEGRNESLAPGKSFTVPAQAALPEGRARTRDCLKLVVTQAPVDFRFLRQDIRDVPRKFDDHLAELLGRAFLIDRDVRPLKSKHDDWTTRLRILEVVEKP